MNTNRLPPPLPGKKRRQCHESTLLRKESKAIHLARTPSLPVEYVGLEQARLSCLDAELKERIAHGLRSMPHLEDVSPWVSSRRAPSKSGPISAASTPQPLSFRTFPLPPSASLNRSQDPFSPYLTLVSPVTSSRSVDRSLLSRRRRRRGRLRRGNGRTLSFTGGPHAPIGSAVRRGEEEQTPRP